MSKFIVTFAPPTSNGDLHIGHLSGPYLAADIFTRTQRLLGNDVLFASYSDDYNNYVVRKARQVNIDQEQLVTTYGLKIGETLKKANIQTDHFMRSLNNRYYRSAVHQFFNNVFHANTLFKSLASIPYCQRCNVYGYEAFARGICNYCGSNSDPSQCEECAMPPDISQMGEIKCILCNQAMFNTQVEQMYINIAFYRDHLIRLYQGKTLRPALRQFIDTVLTNHQLKWAITRPNEWGIEVPGNSEAILHTWLNGIAGYYGAAVEWSVHHGDPTAYRKYWHDPNTTLVNFIGFDCSFSHAIVYPSLIAGDNDYPKEIWVHTNAFLNLNGECFSTSRGHAIWVNDFLDFVNPDILRFYLSLVAPEETTENFDVSEFCTTVNEKFIVPMNKFIHILDEFTSTHINTKVVDYTASLSLIRETWLETANTASFSMKNMGNVLIQLIHLIEKEAYSSPENLPTLLGIYTLFSYPIQPQFSLELANYLDLPNTWGVEWLRRGESLPKVEMQKRHRKAPYFDELDQEILSRFLPTQQMPTPISNY
jgi:methionyl-tRNA synthetase